jgi:hypothetical protein
LAQRRNEGHVTNHHRDGYSAQLWLRWPSASRRFTLSAGVGPYRYYDTTELANVGVTDEHGWGVPGSVAAHWYFRNPRVIEVRYNYAYTTNSITTHTALIGFGYQFEHSSIAGPLWNTQRYGFYPSGQRFELTGMAGSTVVNNFNSPHGSLRERSCAIASHLTSTQSEHTSTKATPGSSSAKAAQASSGSAGPFERARRRKRLGCRQTAGHRSAAWIAR